MPQDRIGRLQEFVSQLRMMVDASGSFEGLQVILVRSRNHAPEMQNPGGPRDEGPSGMLPLIYLRNWIPNGIFYWVPLETQKRNEVKR